MARRPIKCPSCLSEIRRDKIDARKPFPCPSCGKLLRIPSFYYPIPGLAAILACTLLGYLFGLRDMTLLIFVLILWFPISAFFFAVLKLNFNPKIEEYQPNLVDLRPRT